MHSIVLYLIAPSYLLSQKNSYDRIIGTLKQELAEYEELKSGRIAVFQIESFNELPTALIKA